jgi:hypothetical protein
VRKEDERLMKKEKEYRVLFIFNVEPPKRRHLFFGGSLCTVM